MRELLHFTAAEGSALVRSVGFRIPIPCVLSKGEAKPNHCLQNAVEFTWMKEMRCAGTDFCTLHTRPEIRSDHLEVHLSISTAPCAADFLS